MGFIGAAVAIIGTFISASIVSIVATIASAVTYIASSLTVISALVSGAMTAISFLTTSVGAALNYVAALNLTTIGALIKNAAFEMIWSVGTWIETGQAVFSGFMDAIHFRTIMSIHNLAYMTSEAYRGVFIDITTAISRVSSQLGLPAYYIQNALENARIVVHDLGATLGQSWDLSEITWLNTMNDFLETIKEKTDLYSQKPAALLWDIYQKIYKPAYDTKASAARVVFDTIDKNIQAIEKVFENVDTLSKSFSKLIIELPAEVRKEIEPTVRPLLDMWKTGITHEYMLEFRKIAKMIGYNAEALESSKDRLYSLSRLIAFPGNLLEGVDDLSPLSKANQERKIAEIANRAYRPYSDIVEEDFTQTQAAIAHRLANPIPPSKPPAWYLPELEGVISPPGMAPQTRRSWFVGDF